MNPDDALTLAYVALAVFPTMLILGVIALALAFISIEEERSDSQRRQNTMKRRRAFERGALRTSEIKQTN